jgi:carbamoyl-phosphate synthase small subunit
MIYDGVLVLEDGSEYPGRLFGERASVSGEVVFNTGMVGYPESLTDPSYSGQILNFTYPLIGNYGVPAADKTDLPENFESDRIHAAAIVVSRLSHDTSHWAADRSLEEWLISEGIPGIEGVDTRALAKNIREQGALLAKLVPINGNADVEMLDPNLTNLVAGVSLKEPIHYGNDGPRVVVVDTGAKANIIRNLLRAGARVIRVPWDYDFFKEDFDGILLPNGPGDPKMIRETITNVQRALKERIPLLGICLGNQVLALAAGADTYKLNFGHRSQNQPCLEVGTRRCFVTSQNHGYAVNGATLPEGWREWFVNTNDGTNEGIRHDWQPARSVQFHPEAFPGPVDTEFLFDRFLEMLR